MKKTWNLAVVEPNYIICAGLTRIFARTAFRERIECATMDQLWKLIAKDREIDAFLIDVEQDICPFKADIEKLKAQFPDSYIILMADTVDDDQVAQSVQAGVHGFLVKAMRIEAIVKSLELIHLGEPVFPAQALMKSQVVEEPPAPNFNGHAIPGNSIEYNLSAREIEVLMSLGEGRSNKEIARELDISDATVKVHVKAILRKLRLKNRTEAALWATGAGLLETPSHQH